MQFHDKGLKLDKAAVLAYCQIRNRQGYFVTCECCFSICYDVMVCCTSIYRRGHTSHKRAVEAPIVRRMFTSSPQDPRYHMLSHLSAKFKESPKEHSHEPRAALFLNRFTRTLAIMYATSGIEQIVGVPGEDMKGKSFYYCIAENCLEDAIKCLETAKGNDSIAYLRFWFRDPRQEEHRREESYTSDDDVDMTDVTASEDEWQSDMSSRSNGASTNNSSASNSRGSPGQGSLASRLLPEAARSTSGSGSERRAREASTGSMTSHSSPASSHAGNRPIELEAVVSCTSDGLVVCLRRARQQIPQPLETPAQAAHPTTFGPGLFAAPWGINPIMPQPYAQMPYIPASHRAQFPNFSMSNPYAPRATPNHPTSRSPNVSPTAPPRIDFMKAISDVAVFAWALTGINGSLAQYSHGQPLGDSQPPDGLPIWKYDRSDKDFGVTSSRPTLVPAAKTGNGHPVKDPFGDPGLSNGVTSNGANAHGRPWLS